MEQPASDPHDLVPRGKILSVDDCVDLGLTFFHVSPTPLATGEVLLSENYESRPHYELFREPPRREFPQMPRFWYDRRLEAAFEEARQAIASQAPSRRSAIFAFTCEDCVIWFRKRSREGSVIAKVSPLSSSVVFVTDLVWRNLAANVLLRDSWQDPEFPFRVRTQTEALERVAEAYWGGENPKRFGLGSRPEALIEGRVAVCA